MKMFYFDELSINMFHCIAENGFSVENFTIKWSIESGSVQPYKAKYR